MDIQKIISSLHPLERKVISFLGSTKSLNQLVEKSGMQQVEVMRALQWLDNKKVLTMNPTSEETVELDENGKNYLEKGLPEKQVLIAVKDLPLTIPEIEKKTGLSKQEVGVSFGALKSKAAINMNQGKTEITEPGQKLLGSESLEEQLLKKLKEPTPLSKLEEQEKFAFENLKKRKQIIKISSKKDWEFELTELGIQLSKTEIKESDLVENVTSDMLKTNSWENKTFRRYDVTGKVPKIHGGKRHFVRQAIDYIKRIWLDMGFVEMEGNLLQTAFWDLDVLFVPQDHPAREEQDTFYIKDPKKGKLPPIYKKIQAAHEHGGDTGSKGWQAPWSKDVASENMLRTHTTVLSAQAIAKLKESDLPAKFFSVNRVFRNEALDWKHLFEFVQVEGIVIDKNANLKNLKGYLKEFYLKMGFKDVRMRPAHFPYTEPSLEIDVLHPTKNEWVELGGSGIFRPELVKPLLGIDVPVLAWGQGMERGIMEYFDIKDVRDLYKNDLKQIREMKSWME